MDIFSPFFSRKCWESVRFAAAESWFKPPMFFFDRSKTVIQHFWRSPLSNWKLKKKIRKIRKKHKNSCFLMSVASLYTACFVMFCAFLYGPFCHGAHKLDLSTLFTTFFLLTSLPFIFILIMVLFLAFGISVLLTLFLNNLVRIQEILCHIEVLVKHLLYTRWIVVF